MNVNFEFLQSFHHLDRLDPSLPLTWQHEGVIANLLVGKMGQGRLAGEVEIRMQSARHF